MDGATTSANTKYPRSELREYATGSTSTKAAWNPNSGTHIMRGKTKTGRDYENYYVLVYEFEGDKIARIWEYLDKDYTNRIFDDIQLAR